MQIPIAYGKKGLHIELPEQTHVIQSEPLPGLQDERSAILDALRNPVGLTSLQECVSRGDKVVVTHSDITRPVPNDRILPVILEELESAGVHREDITLLNALGTHRQQTDDELSMMLGEDIVSTYRCLQHNAFDDSNLVSMGTTSSATRSV